MITAVPTLLVPTLDACNLGVVTAVPTLLVPTLDACNLVWLQLCLHF